MNYENVIRKVIEEEEKLIGPVASRKAEGVEGVEVSEEGDVSLDSDGANALKEVLKAYEGVVGENAVSALKRNVRNELDEVPAELEDNE